MRHVAGTIGGLSSGFLIYMMVTMLSGITPTPNVVFMTFFPAWIATHFIIARGTKGFCKPMSRAFLIGSAEWLIMAVVGVIFSGHLVAKTSVAATSEAAKAGAALGGGIASFLMGGFSLGMAVACAVGFIVFHIMGKEGAKAMAADEQVKPCPDCAEQVNLQARKCKHCGHMFAQTEQTLSQAA